MGRKLDLQAETLGLLKVSPYGFMIWARHFLKCRKDFVPPDDYFSPVPHFLLCLAIELALKARHLHDPQTTVKDVKDEYSHNLIKALDALPPGTVSLTREQRLALEEANKIYFPEKGFEYFSVKHALRGFTEFPSLETLDAIAALIVTSDP